MQLNHSTEVSVLLPQSTSTNESVPLMDKFKNYVTVKTELMHSKPLMNKHYHFPIIVELVTSHMSHQKPKQEEGWSLSIQRKQLHLLVCLACVLWVCVCVCGWAGMCVCVCVGGGGRCCIVMLKAYIFRQTVWAVEATLARLLVPQQRGTWNDCSWMTVDARTFSQNGINASICSGTTLRQTVITLQRNPQTSFVRILNDLDVIHSIRSRQPGSKTRYGYSFSSLAHTWVISNTILYLHMELCVIFKSYINK
jgi:hypothetical protein